MPRTIYKYPITPPDAAGNVYMNLPVDALILAVAVEVQPELGRMVEKLMLHVLVGQTGAVQTGVRHLYVLKPGMFMPSDKTGTQYIGMVTVKSGMLWHVFEVKSSHEAPTIEGRLANA